MPYVDRVAETALSNDQHFRQTIDSTTGRPQSALFAKVISAAPGAAYPLYVYMYGVPRGERPGFLSVRSYRDCGAVWA